MTTEQHLVSKRHQSLGSSGTAIDVRTPIVMFTGPLIALISRFLQVRKGWNDNDKFICYKNGRAYPFRTKLYVSPQLVCMYLICVVTLPLTAFTYLLLILVLWLHLGQCEMTFTAPLTNGLVVPTLHWWVILSRLVVATFLAWPPTATSRWPMQHGVLGLIENAQLQVGVMR